MRVADVIAKFLKHRGVDSIFMLTGNGAMYINDAIEQSGIQYYCARNEAALPMMAAAYARYRQSLAAICLTSGPGSTNAIPGLAEAFVDAAPIMIFSGQVQRSHTTHNLKLPDIRSFGTAEIDIIPIVKPLTKYAVMINEPTSIRYHLEKAAHLALSGRPGPVWIDVPMDIQFARIDEAILEGYFPDREAEQMPQASDRDIERVVVALKSAKRPLIMGGHGIRQAGAISEFKTFLETSNTACLFSRLGQDILPHSHPNVFGQAGIKGTRSCKQIMRDADFVLSLGCRLAIQLVGHQFEAFNEKAQVAMVDVVSDELKKPGVRIELPIHSDVRVFLEKMNARLTQEKLPDYSRWISFCQKLRKENPMVTKEMTGDPINLYYFMSRLDALADERHIFTTDAGTNYYVGGQVYHFEKGQRELTSGTFAAMGLSIPLAIGAAIAAPDKQVLAVTGDGSLELNIQELKTMSHYNLNIKLFVINNGGYVSMRNWQDHFFEGRRIDTEENTGIGTLNLEKIAGAFDLPYARIEKVSEIDDKVRELIAQNGPVFVEVFTDQNQRVIEPLLDAAFDTSSKSGSPF